MKTYHGVRLGGDASVLVMEPQRATRPLAPRLDLRNHSPTGFEWGYGGSGPAQLALAILTDLLGAGPYRHGDGYTPAQLRALVSYQEFKRRVIAAQPYKGFMLTADQVERELLAIENAGDAESAAEIAEGAPL